MLRECNLSSVQYLDSSSIATAERAVRAKHRMPSPFLVPISTASVFRRSSATVLCTACGERIGGQSTGLTSDAQSIGSGRAACIGLAWSASLRAAVGARARGGGRRFFTPLRDPGGSALWRGRRVAIGGGEIARGGRNERPESRPRARARAVLHHANLRSTVVMD